MNVFTSMCQTQY